MVTKNHFLGIDKKSSDEIGIDPQILSHIPTWDDTGPFKFVQPLSTGEM